MHKAISNLSAISYSIFLSSRTCVSPALTSLSYSVASRLLHVGVWEKEIKAKFNTAEVKGRLTVYFRGKAESAVDSHALIWFAIILVYVCIIMQYSGFYNFYSTIIAV